MTVARLVSGGQTGVDRAALEVGRERGIPIGGWCPAGGLAEDLTEPPGVLRLFPELTPTESADPRERTERNVRDTDATLILLPPSVVSPGTLLTIDLARRLGKRHLVADPAHHGLVRSWLPPGLLNVAGPRESEAPGIHDAVAVLLRAIL
ncbi:MAG: putative molybdenum carrier protein [Nocardioidaceae bacterium]|nr:putative molybdenum carrier protein [Nocardioidaceae bacterium]